MKFKIVHSDDKRAWAFCPVHKDIHTPNLAITLTDDYYGYAKCFCCGWVYRLSDRQMKELNLSKKKRVKPVSIDWGALSIKYRKDMIEKYPLFKDVLYRQWNIGEYILNYFRMGFDGEAYTFPMRIGRNIVGIQRRFSDGSKCCVEGSQLGLFIPAGLNYDEVLIICEGLSDTVVTQDIFRDGYYDIIGRPNCNYGKEIIRDWINDIWGYDEEEGFCDREIIIVPDNDSTGEKGAMELFDEIVTNTKISCKIFKFNGAKDIRKYIQKHGKEMIKHELEEFINE